MRRFDEVLGFDDRHAADGREHRDHQLGVAVRCVDAGADRRRAEIHFGDQRTRFAQPRLVFADHDREGEELLAQGHRHGVLQLGAADLQHALELVGLGLERAPQLGHLGEQAVDAEPGREAQRGRVDIVGALVVRVQRVVAAFLEAHVLERAVGDHLVGVHVGRGTGAALDHVDDELIVQRAANDLVAGDDDRAGSLAVDHAELGVGLRRGLLHVGESPHEVGDVADRLSADREVLDRAGAVHAPIRIGRDVLVAEKVVLATRRRSSS